MATNVPREIFAGDARQTDAAAQPSDISKKSSFFGLPGGGKAIFAFALSLLAYTLQTEFAQYVQQSLNYRKPFLSLYLGHSAFVLLFPIHLLFLKFTTSHSVSHYLHLVSQNLRWQLETPAKSLPDPGPDAVRRRLSSASGRGAETSVRGIAIDGGESMLRAPVSFLEQKLGFHVLRLLGLLSILTLGITIPALSWYSAVPMTSMADITAIYNTFSVWALVFSVWFLGEKWEKRKVFSVLLACFGVVVVAYGGADHRKKPKPMDPINGKPSSTEPQAILAVRSLQAAVTNLLSRQKVETIASSSQHNPVLGDLLAFFGAVTMAAYEMAFKLIGTLPDEPKQAEMYSTIGRNHRRVRSYIRYQDAHDNARRNHETEGLLNTSHNADERSSRLEYRDDQLQHVIGDDLEVDEMADDRGAKRSDSLEVKPSSSAADKLVEQDRLDYQSITPPSEMVSMAANGDTGGNAVKITNDGVRVQSNPVLPKDSVHGEETEEEDGEEQVTESELEDGEEDLVRSGATRLQRTRSQLSTHRLSSAVGQNISEVRASSEQHRSRATRRTSSIRQAHDASIPPPLPFGLHANTMTAGIGLITLCTFWIGLPIADRLGWEPFELPHNLRTCFSISMVVICGIFFNAAFMILLSLWGPVLASVSCLMTTILVEIADVLLGHKLKWLSVLGCTLIGAGFAVLVSGDASH